jgi:hypothetical protein
VEHQLICGKPKREREEEVPCNNTRDPFSLDDFEGMDSSLIIHIGADCFHLPSLYAWVINQGHDANPLTNLPFTEEQLEMIRSEARNRFPFEISVMAITGKKQVIQTTTLASPLSIIPLLLPGTSTLLEFMTKLSATGQSFSLSVLGNPMVLVELMNTQGQTLSCN